MNLDEQFPFRTEGRNYLNTCGLGIPPKVVLDDLAGIYLHLAKHPHAEYLFEEDIAAYREHVARLTHGEDTILAFTRNVTEALMLAAQAIPFQKGDEIVTTSMEHRVAINCWHLRQLHNPELDLKINVAQIPIDATQEQILELIFAQVTAKTRVICVAHVDRYFGLLFPVAEICARARRDGIITIVDGAQTIGLIDVDLKHIDCDIYVSCLHKWYLGPMVLGTIHIHRRIFPYLIRTYAAASRWHDEKPEGRQFGGRELGTRCVPVEKCLGSLIKFHERYDDFIYSPRHQAKSRLVEALRADKRVVVAPVIDLLGQYGITTLKVDGIDSNLIVKTLESKYQISVGITSRPASGDWVRVSTFFYNTNDDVDRFMRALDDIIRSNSH